MQSTNYLTLYSSNLARLNLSTLTGNTITLSTSITAPTLFYSTLRGSTVFGSTTVMSSITASFLTLSTLTVSSINGQVPGTGTGSSGPFSTLTVSSLVTSSINATPGNVGIGTAVPNYPLSVAGTGGSIEVNRYNAGTNFGSCITYSLTSATGSFRGEYVRTYGGTNGNIATSLQSQANGFYCIDLANAGVFASNTNAVYSQFFMTTSSAVFYNVNVGIGTTQPSASYALNVVGAIYATGDITAFSDQRYKHDIIRLDHSLDAIRHLNGYSYTRNDYRPGERQIGLLAQEVKEVLPEAVSYDSTNDKYSVNYNCLIAPVVEAIKELHDRIEAQDKIISDQQAIIQKLLDRLGPE